MRTPAHGRGQLRVGGTNKGGPGRPPDEVRKALTGSFADRVAILEAFADDENEDAVTRLRALEVLAKYGLGTANQLNVNAVDRAWVAENLSRIRAIILARLPRAQATALLEEIASQTFKES